MATFKVLLGVSEGGGAHPSLDIWLSKVDRNIEVHESSEGNIYYLIGDFATPQRAREYLEQLKEKGLEPLDYFPLIDGRVMQVGWEDMLEIGDKKHELTPGNS